MAGQNDRPGGRSQAENLGILLLVVLIDGLLVLANRVAGGLMERAYISLADEHRAIEEADFRRKLAKAIKKIR